MPVAPKVHLSKLGARMVSFTKPRKKKELRKRNFFCDWFNMTNVGGRIRTLRGERQMTLPALAEKAKVSKGLLSKLENDQDPNPSLKTLRPIADALDVTLSELLESGKIQAKRLIPDKAPAWLNVLSKALSQEGKQPDEDILQALYVLQSRKGNVQKDATAWVHRYKSLELNFTKGRR
jgi:transcriptional regulator with XRE-family HTH domain